MPAISVDRVRHSYGRRRILHEATFSVEHGESVAISGKTGSGKSTLLSIIAGLERPSGGQVTVAGVTVTGLSHRKGAELRLNALGVVLQSGSVIPTLSAAENVSLPLLLAGRSSVEAIAIAHDLLKQLGIYDPDTLGQSLSGGEQQRVAIARALVNDPEVIIADEPTASLDGETRDQVCDLLYSQASERNCALLIISHDRTVCSRADRELELREGKLAQRAAIRPAV